MIKVSVVIPVYNRKADLERCLGSVQSTSGDDYEIIAVDDASTDGSYEALQSVAYKNLRVFRNEVNRGVNYTRNRGIEQSTGKYVLFLDSDDKLMPGALDVVIKNVDESPYVRHFLFYDSDFVENTAITESYTTNYEKWLSAKIYGDFTHVILREVLLRFPFFEQFRAYEELNWLRIYRETSPQKVVPVVVKWRDTDRTDNLTKSLRLKTTEAIEGKFNYLKFYFDLYGRDLYSFDPDLYKKKFHHALMLGIASARKKEALEMIAHSPIKNKPLYRSFVSLSPSQLLNKAIKSR